MDENSERRNHYRELAGIENYASKFDGKGMLMHLKNIVLTENISM